MTNKVVLDPMCPHVFFSGGEDGTVRRFDTRQKHSCDERSSRRCDDNVVINLREGDRFNSR